MIILDTHIWLWWMHNPGKLSTKAKETIEGAEYKGERIVVSAISVWEVAIKASLGKLNLNMDLNNWFQKAQAYSSIFIEPLSPLDAIASVQLPGEFHKDPADRMIIAIARRHDCALLTVDQKILEYPHVKTIS